METMTFSSGTIRLLAALFILGFTPSLVSTQVSAPATATADEEKNSSEIIHWTSVLNRIALEAKTLRDETARPEAVIAVADAFWSVDKKKSRELFHAALDLALSIDSAKVRASCLRRIIVAAGKRDSELANDLVSRLQINEEPGNRSQSLGAAIDLAKINPKAAEAIALTNARNGPSFETAELIFELHKQDAGAAVRVFSANLKKIQREDPSQLLWLAGFPFGFHEALGGSIDPSKLYGVFGLNSEGLTANPGLASALLTTAVVTVDRILEEAPGKPPEQAEAYKALAFFILTYLSSQVERYRPDLISQWFPLQQSVASLIGVRRREDITKQVASIAASRLRANTKSEKVDSNDEFISDIEKLQGSCQRDEAYAHAAFRLSYKSDFKKALSLAEKVNDLNLRSDIIQFIYFDMSLFAISPKSLGGLDEGLAYAQRVNKPDQRGFLYLKLAEFAAKSDSDRARLILSDALKTSEQIEDLNFRAALLFASAYNLSTLDSTFLESFSALEKAIRLLKDSKELRIDKISLARRINFNCDSANPHWYGGFDGLGELNLIATLVRISVKDWRIAEELATELPEGLNRIRSLAALAGERIRAAKALEKPRPGSPKVQ